MDEHTISYFFIGYAVNSKGFRFYCPSHSPNIIEARNAKFLEEHKISGSGSQKVEFEEVKYAPVSPLNDLVVIQNIEEQPVEQSPPEWPQQSTIVDPTNQTPHKIVGVRISTRIRRPAISSDYEVIFKSLTMTLDLRMVLVHFSQAMNGENR